MTKPEIRINDEIRMTNEPDKRRREFDLEERTAQFGEEVIAFAKTIPVNAVTREIIGQLVRAATGVGSNYCEADDCDSKKDFRFKIGISRREARESKHWLRMTVAAEPQLREAAAALWQEAKELNLIFGAIRRSKGEDS
jgi:four helix bundle protein